MPRPKRTIVKPVLTAPLARKSATKKLANPPSGASDTSFNELYDVSDDEKIKLSRAPKTRRNKGKEKIKHTTSLQRTPELDGCLVNGAEHPFVHKNNVQTISDVLLSSPIIELGRKELANHIGSNLTYNKDIVLLRSNSSKLDAKRNNCEVPKNNTIKSRSPDTSLNTTNLNYGKTPGKPTFSSGFQQSQPAIFYCSDDNENDFSIEDVSTPMNIDEMGKMARKITTPASKSRKRKVSELQIPCSSPVVSLSASPILDEMIPATNPLKFTQDDNQSSNVSAKHSVNIISDEKLDSWDEIMAPPRSSSSIPSSPLAQSNPQIHSRSKKIHVKNLRSSRAKTPHTSTENISNLSSPPSLTYSPDQQISDTTRENKVNPIPVASNFSTAQLQSLLPRRRLRKPREPPNNAYFATEADIARPESDDDELAHSAEILRAPGRKHANTSIKKGRPLRTYGETKRKISNPEKSGDDLGIQKKLGVELKKAARKFLEVDQWDLEFEDCSGHSSSPLDAR
ncbi:BgTH12-00898 [Blumeria graminis f. sp. triticale]|uniref:BgTH12-00898 n=1 Tax=Blumeria graminis f. sp. triticale TaxID=1689686 RepID=A0A9W4D7U1_BLUGR|nr:BgTH12-00898 [Blumeria graminis f. sp. triticale]